MGVAVDVKDALGQVERIVKESEEKDARIEGLLNDHSSVPQLHRILAEQYRNLGREEEAIEKFDIAAEMFLENGKSEQAIRTINMILSMKPSNAEEYRQALAQIQAG